MLSITLAAVLVVGITVGLTKFALAVMEWMLEGGRSFVPAIQGGLAANRLAAPESFLQEEEAVFSSSLASV